MFVLAALMSACAVPPSAFLNGGTLTDHDYARQGKAQYEAPKCTRISNGEPSKAPKATYHLIEDHGQPTLFERGQDGTGTLFTNRWTAPDGDHYFAWIGSTGMEFVVPPQGAGTRFAYEDCKMEKGADGVTKPKSPATYQCPLTPVPGPSSSAP